MTVEYNAEIATASFSGFLKLLVRWRGSIYKLLWRDFIVYVILYYVLFCINLLALNDYQKKEFADACKYCNEVSAYIPVTFVLGFYVSNIVNRWWDQFNAIPWPSKFAILVTAHVHGQDDTARMIRRTLVRYIVLGFILTLTSICQPVRLRFPTIDHLRKAGLLLQHEQKMLEEMTTPYNKFYVPFVWACTLIARSRMSGRITDDFGMQCMSDEINMFRSNCQALFNYDWISIPIVYTQVVTIAVYTYSAALLMGQQYTEGTKSVPFPFLCFMQFFFYQGWLKVGEELMNPFGEDDDDFEMNSIIDYYLQLCYVIVDVMHEDVPELIKDDNWDNKNVVIPYTEAALKYNKLTVKGSAALIVLADNEPDENPEPVPEPGSSTGFGRKRSSGGPTQAFYPFHRTSSPTALSVFPRTAPSSLVRPAPSSSFRQSPSTLFRPVTFNNLRQAPSTVLRSAPSGMRSLPDAPHPIGTSPHPPAHTDSDNLDPSTSALPGRAPSGLLHASTSDTGLPLDKPEDDVRMDEFQQETIRQLQQMRGSE